jgi:hypothetical protein
MLEASKAASIRDFWSRLKAGFSVGAAVVRPGRDNELVDRVWLLERTLLTAFERDCRFGSP